MLKGEDFEKEPGSGKQRFFRVLRFRVWGLGFFRVLRFRVWGLGFRV